MLIIYRMVIARQEYLERVLEKTDRYTDLIQTETGTDMGRTDIKRMLQLPTQLVKTGKDGIPERDYLGNFLAPIILGSFFLGYMITLRDTPALYFHPAETIFVNTRKKIRENITNNLPMGIDRLVVHELGHKLWQKLGGENDTGTPRGKMIEEGFATYCDTQWFAHLYPSNENLDLSHLWGHSDYQAGGLRIMRFVDKYGNDILSEIPRRWKELDRNTPMIEPEILASTQDQLREFEGKLIYD